MRFFDRDVPLCAVILMILFIVANSGFTLVLSHCKSQTETLTVYSKCSVGGFRRDSANLFITGTAFDGPGGLYRW